MRQSLMGVPWFLVRLRLRLGPAILLGAWLHIPGSWLAAGLAVAFLSDVFDGIIARRLGVATPELRLADSQTDVILYVFVLASLVMVRPDVLWAVRVPLAVLVVLQLLSWRMDRIKFGRPTALHSYTAKAWGITLFLASGAMFCLPQPEPYLWVALAMGYVSNLEDLAIKAVLPSWHHDVGSVWHAWQIRRKELSSALPPGE